MILNNKMIFVAIVSMLSLFIITLHSCNPLGSNTDSTYSLTGRMLKDCSGEPYANYSLTFYIPGDGMFTKKAVLGTVSTDDKGYFKLSNIPSNKNSNINLQHIIDANYVTTWGSFNIPDSANIYDDGAVYDLGDYYGAFEEKTVIKFTIDNSSLLTSDSLFVGYNKNKYKVIFPIPSQYIYMHSITRSNARKNQLSKDDYLSWGIKRSFYDSLYIPNTGINVSDFTIKTKIEICTYPDTTYYSIP